MQKNEFGLVLRAEREKRGLTLNGLAYKVSEFGAGKGAAANLSRMEKGTEAASETRIGQIADALASCDAEPHLSRDRLYKTLLEASPLFSSATTGEIDYLWEQCQKRLKRTTSLKGYEIENILHQISIPTMKRLATLPDDEKALADYLQNLSSELQEKATRLGEAVGGANSADVPDHVVLAGRATIHVKGTLSAKEEKLLSDIARLLRNSLS